MPRYELIDDPDDPRVLPYRALRDRDLRGHQGAFVLEGEVVLRVLLGSGRFRLRSLLLADRRRDKLQDALERLGDDVPVYLAPQGVLDGIVGFAIHRGVLALGERGAQEPLPSLLGRAPTRSLVVALAGVVNHDNVGGIFRNAAAFGAWAVAMDHVTCDPLYRKAIRVSVGGALTVPFARASSEAELISELMCAGYTVFALTPRGEIDLGRLPALPDRIALLLGAEGTGLEEESLASCRTLRVPMAPGWDSLNVAVTCGIALFALRARGS